MKVGALFSLDKRYIEHIKKITENKLKSCPHCGKSGEMVRVNRVMFSGSIFDKYLYFIECPSCHWCGKTKLFLWRAMGAWNRMNRKNGDENGK